MDKSQIADNRSSQEVPAEDEDFLHEAGKPANKTSKGQILRSSWAKLLKDRN